MLHKDSETISPEGSGRMDTEEERELTADEDETIRANNKYLVDDPRFKSRYDAVDILISGNIPELKDDGERYVCANEVGKFIQTNGVNGSEENLAKLLNGFSTVHKLVLLQLLDAQQIAKLANNSYTRPHLVSVVGTM